MQNIIFLILALSIMGPIIGSALGVFLKLSKKSMMNIIAFAGGVMLAISFLHLIPESLEMSNIYIVVIGIGAGAILMYVVDRLLPHIHPELCSQEQGCHLHKTATYLIFGIFIHNFPEGMAIALGAVIDVRLSVMIALAIAIHNIPEGICTSAPYYYCTKKKLKSFLVSSATAIPVVLGFFFAYWLYNVIPAGFVGFVSALTAGLMIYITADEIIPVSCTKEKSHMPIFSLVLGIIFVLIIEIIV